MNKAIKETGGNLGLLLSSKEIYIPDQSQPSSKWTIPSTPTISGNPASLTDMLTI